MIYYQVSNVVLDRPSVPLHRKTLELFRPHFGVGEEPALVEPLLSFPIARLVDALAVVHLLLKLAVCPALFVAL